MARHNLVIEAVRAEDRAAGKAEGEIGGKIEALVAILAPRDIDPDSAAPERILRERDPATRSLDRPCGDRCDHR